MPILFAGAKLLVYFALHGHGGVCSANPVLVSGSMVQSVTYSFVAALCNPLANGLRKCIKGA